MKIPIIAAALMIVGPQATYAADVPGNKTTKVVLKTGGTGVSGVLRDGQQF